MGIFLSDKLYSALDSKFIEAVKLISNCADEFGFSAYIIGGVVRDLILNKPIYDIDIVIEGNAIDFCRKIEQKQQGKIYRIAEDFGTVKILLNDNLEVDVASTRTELYPKAGHLPVVNKIGCTLKEDILRRDFTVNALALSLNKSNFGEVIDYTSGLADIEQKQLRVLHDQSFIDDPTRIIRALRFKHKLNFNLESHTKTLQDEYLSQFNENDICYERIKQVVRLAFNLNSQELLQEFVDEKIYKLIGNTIRNLDCQKAYTTINSNLNKININEIWLVYLACLITEQQAQKLNLTGKEKEIISCLDMLLAKNFSAKTNFEIYQFFQNAPAESIVAYIAIKNSTEAQKYLNELKDIKLNINGKTLMELGLQEGKTIGNALEKILEEKINGNIFSQEDELNYAKRLTGNSAKG